MATTELLSLLALVLNAFILPLAYGAFRFVRDTDKRLTAIEVRIADHIEWEMKQKYHHRGVDTE